MMGKNNKRFVFQRLIARETPPGVWANIEIVPYDIDDADMTITTLADTAQEQ